jgi:hypothetical protein
MKLIESPKIFSIRENYDVSKRMKPLIRTQINNKEKQKKY